MTGQCYIDGVDIYATYGVIITEGGYDDFFKLPAMVEPDKNDWAESDGIEVDLTEPTLQPREIEVSFARVRHVQWRAFVQFITMPDLRLVHIPYLGRSWALRYDSMTEIDLHNNADLFTIKFIEDTPLVPTLSAPVGGAPIESVLELDSISMDNYGIIVEDGLSDFDKTPPLKQNLTRTSSVINGQVYDAGVALFSDKEVAIRCAMIATSVSELWLQLDSLFATLMQPGERTLSYSGRGYRGYYRKMDNVKLLAHTDGVVVRFDLKVNFTAFRVGLVTYLLSTEAMALITTEDGLIIELEN